MKSDDLRKELEKIKAVAQEIEAKLASEEAKKNWPPKGYYTTFHVLAGMMLGFFGAASSLLFNIVGSVIVHQHPLQLIRIYLTFPLGEKALSIESGATLALGCCLYLGTGMVLGIPFHLVLSRFFDKSTALIRLAVVTAMGLGLWLLNFYVLLSWLQPLFFGGNWIVTMIPWWVGALTHLVFAWTMLLIDRWGHFDVEGHL